MPLIKHIIQFQQLYPFFNRIILTPDDIIAWLELIGVEAIPDITIKGAFSFIAKTGKRITLYNPHQNPDALTLCLGHELGHWLLGHIDHQGLYFSPNSLFARSGIEKDAGIIGFLCWLPTPELEKHIQQNMHLPDELAWELKTCDTEWNKLVEYMNARLRIYGAYARFIKSLINSSGGRFL